MMGGKRETGREGVEVQSEELRVYFLCVFVRVCTLSVRDPVQL